MNPTITEKHQRFLELRSQGKTYDQIAADLGVSRRTLFYWKQELQEELAFEETAELETLHQELLGTRQARARRLAKRLAAIEDELDKRSLADLSTARLFTLADSLRRQLTKETTPAKRGRAKLQLSRDQIPSSECHDDAKPVQTAAKLSLPAPHESKSLVQVDEAPLVAAPSIHESKNPATQSPAQCKDSAILVQSPSSQQPSEDSAWKQDLSAALDADLPATQIPSPEPQCKNGAIAVQSPPQHSPELSQLPPRPPQLERMLGHKIDVTKIVGWKGKNTLFTSA